MTTRAVTYREASRQLIAQARAELDVGDLRQASEKAWGAAAQMAKAAASSRGWDHDQHRHLWNVAKDLTNEAEVPLATDPPRRHGGCAIPISGIRSGRETISGRQ